MPPVLSPYARFRSQVYQTVAEPVARPGAPERGGLVVRTLDSTSRGSPIRSHRDVSCGRAEMTKSGVAPDAPSSSMASTGLSANACIDEVVASVEPGIHHQ
jgi:hypothetical protein